MSCYFFFFNGTATTESYTSGHTLALHAALPILAGPVAAVAEQGAPAWGCAGATGPANWGSLAAEYATCGDGSAQSPIDLGAADAPGRQPMGTVDYKPLPLTINQNNTRMNSSH